MLAAVACAVGGCSSLPKAGPDTRDIVNTVAHNPSTAPYDIVRISTAVADVASSGVTNGFAASFSKSRYVPNIKIGVGDSVSVTIFEATSGGLFSGDAGTQSTAKNVTLPDQTVDSQGKITVPYAGRVSASGRTPAQVEQEIEALLKDKAIQPEVMVTVSSPTSSSVTVTGDVAASKRVPLSLKGDRILDADCLPLHGAGLVEL